MGYSHTSQINYRMYLFTSEHVTILRCTWHWPTRCKEAQWCRQPCTVPPTWPKTENQKPQWTAKSEKKTSENMIWLLLLHVIAILIDIYIYTHVSDSLFASIFWGRWELFPKSKLGRGFPAALPPASLASTIRVRSHLNDHCFGKNQDFIVLFEHQKMMGAVERKVSEKKRWKEVLGRIRSHVKNGRWSPIFWKSTGNGQKTWQKHSKDLYLYPVTSYSIADCRAFSETLRHSKSPFWRIPVSMVLIAHG